MTRVNKTTPTDRITLSLDKTFARTWSFEMRLETGAPSMTDVLLPENIGRDERLQRLDAVIERFSGR